jgi:nucleoside-diphosphate-sugar epimerase
MKRVLVTGANGWIGGYALPLLLARGFEVHGLSRSRSGKAPDGVSWHPHDLLRHDPAPMLGKLAPTHLLHLAWFTEHGAFWTAPENHDWLAASLRLMKAFHAAGGKRFVFAGTAAEYDWTKPGEVEDPRTLYGRSKLQFSRALFDSGKSAAVGRINLLYGPGEPKTRLVAGVIRSALDGKPILCTDGKQVRDFLFVRDVADALAALLDSEVQGAVNLGSGTPITIRELVETLCRLIPARSAPRFGAWPRPLGDPDVLLPSMERLKKEVGWAPRVPLEDGLKAAIEALR